MGVRPYFNFRYTRKKGFYFFSLFFFCICIVFVSARLLLVRIIVHARLIRGRHDCGRARGQELIHLAQDGLNLLGRQVLGAGRAQALLVLLI